jgi:fluoride exporter
MYGYAALGGVLGALARWAVAEALPQTPGAWPWATFAVNVAGCLLIGVLLAVLLTRFPHSPWLRPFLAVGVLGGFTTYSTFAVEAVRLTDGGHPLLAGAYVLASVTGGVAAVVVGLLAGRAVVGRSDSVDAELRAGEGET